MQLKNPGQNTNYISIDSGDIHVGTCIPEGTSLSNVTVSVGGVVVTANSNVSLINKQRAREALLSPPEESSKIRSLVFDSRVVPKNVFRGSIEDYLQNYENLSHIDTIQIIGPQIGPGVYDASYKLNPNKFSEFLPVIARQNIKRLGLTGCTTDAEIAAILGKAMTTNNALTELAISVSQFKEKGMLSFMEGLKSNHSLTVLTGESNNVECYTWSQNELKKLRELILTNQIIQTIHFPQNQIPTPEDILILAGAYKDREKYKAFYDGELATLKDFECCGHPLPDFNKENILNGVLDAEARIQYRP